MNIIEVGKTYTAIKHKTGQSALGDYELLKLRDSKNNNEITIFVTNGPLEMPESGGAFKVNSISEVRFGMRKSQDHNGNEKWYPMCSVIGEVELAEATEPTFVETDELSPWELPD